MLSAISSFFHSGVINETGISSSRSSTNSVAPCPRSRRLAFKSKWIWRTSLTNGLSAKLESFFDMMAQGDEFAQHGFDLLVKRGEPEKYFDTLKARGFFDPAKN